MDKKGCVFVIGADNDIIIKALKKTYQEDALRFMDKIVQVTFNLPKIPEEGFNSFIEDFGNDFGGELKDHFSLIIPAMENNPRNMKRFINDLSLQWGLVENKGLGIAYKTLLLWKVLEKGHALFHHELKGDSGFRTLKTMQEKIDDEFKKEDRIDPDLIHENMEKIPESLRGYFNNINLVRIVDQFRLDKKENLEALITLAGITGSRLELSGTASAHPRAGDDRKMVLIPKGGFIYQENEIKTIDYDYEMDIYPVTNALFEKFILAGGYADERWWAPAGWQWREKNNVRQPEYWEHETYNDPEQPVVGVSWYEADAYARWLTEPGKDKYTFRLPTEEEWERAARGEDGRTWPWGNTFDKDKCNSAESKLGKPSRVTAYPNGTSYYGCYDMAGNVWEWTSLIFNKNTGSYALRGGAFSGNSGYCRCASRFSIDPCRPGGGIGFRCARIKSRI